MRKKDAFRFLFRYTVSFAPTRVNAKVHQNHNNNVLWLGRGLDLHIPKGIKLHSVKP